MNFFIFLLPLSWFGVRAAVLGARSWRGSRSGLGVLGARELVRDDRSLEEKARQFRAISCSHPFSPFVGVRVAT